MYGKIKRLSILIVFPFLLGSSHWKLTQNNINTKDRDYEVIEATTGRKDTSQFYAEDPVIKTHIKATSAIRKALANEGIDSSQVRILLYYDPLAIRDDLPPRMWNSKSHPSTISSPWIDLTKTVTTNGETRITIRIDATAARLTRDLFSNPDDQQNMSGFLKIASITESCLMWMTEKYTETRYKVKDFDSASLICASKELKYPLLSLFELAEEGLVSLFLPVIYKLDYSCQDSAKKYYSQLYPRLVIKALQILKNTTKYDPTWWKTVIEQVEPIRKCD